MRCIFKTIMRSKYSSGMRCNVMNFQILIDDTFINTCGDVLSPLNNKSILSLVNDFEDGKWRYKIFICLYGII